MEVFSTLDVYKNILELDGLKGELKLVDFAKYSIADIIWEHEENQALAKVTKFQRQILTAPATSTSSERSFFFTKA